MGFSLRMFFEELEHVLQAEGVDPLEKLEILKALVDFNKKYAEECGELE